MRRFVIIFLTFSSLFESSKLVSIGNVMVSDDFIRIPLKSRNSRAVDGNGVKVELENVGDAKFGLSIGIGTPPQLFDVLIDTGSADLWVTSAKAKDDPQCHQLCDAKHLFNETASSTFKRASDDFFLGYAAGDVNGTIGIDTVSVTGLTATNQRFGLAIRETAHINLYPFDGIMGLATAAAVQTDNETLVDRLFQQGQIKKRLLCIKLHYKKISLPSELIIGGCDVDAKYWLPVVRNFLWTITLNKIVLTSTTNGSELLTIEPNAEAIIDTGGNIGMPTDYINAITKTLGASWNGQHYLVDCDVRKELPNIEFHFNEAKVVLTLDDYSWTYFSECQVGLNERAGSDNFSFGPIFFTKATVIFDMDNNRIGLAEIK